jgi:hypothetical protein
MDNKFFVYKAVGDQNPDAHFAYQVLAEGSPIPHGDGLSLEEAEDVCNRWNREDEKLQLALAKVSEHLGDAVSELNTIEQDLSLPTRVDLEGARHALIILKDDIARA